MFSMTDPLPGREPATADPQTGEGDWPQVAATLANLDARVRSLTAHRQVSGADIRHTRRESRRVLRQHTTDLGVCESCRRAPAVRRVVFADLAVFAVCTDCSAGAVGGVAA